MQFGNRHGLVPYFVLPPEEGDGHLLLHHPVMYVASLDQATVGSVRGREESGEDHVLGASPAKQSNRQ